MRVSIPEYVKPIANAGHELVMSTPTWYGKHGTHATIFVDAATWPPRIASHAMQVTAAARFPDGRWVCAVRSATGGWHLEHFEDIHATARVRRDDLPFTHVPEDPEDDDGPVEQLHVFGGVLFAIPAAGVVQVHNGERWNPHPTLRRAGNVVARTVRYLDGADVLEWGDALFDGRARPLDSRGCTHFVRVPEGPLLALHDSQLVEVTETALVPRLAGHEVTALDAGPAGMVVISLARDDERGTVVDHALYDPAADVLAALAEEVVGKYPTFVTCTADHALVLHDTNQHELVPVRVDALARTPAGALPVPARLELAVLDDVGAASRPLVATTGQHIAIVLGDTLRFHTVDAPTAVVAHARTLVGVGTRRGLFGALDAEGVLHEYMPNGVLLQSRPVIAAPRSLAVVNDAWAIIGKDRVVLLGERRTRVLELPGPLAVAADPGGDVVIACEDHRLVHWTGAEQRDLPPTIEQVIAVAALGDGVFACLGRRDLYLLDLANPELASLGHRLRRPHLASLPPAGRLAACSSPASVTTQDLEGDKLVAVPKGSVQYSSYSEPADEEVTVRGLAFMDDGRLVVLLDEGRGNIITPNTGAALKLDPQPGDARSRWIFISGGAILIAD